MTAAALPFVGPRAFMDGERLYGRTREVEDLLDLLVANRVALLYSPSGAGKTSLIAAGLLPRLREEGFTVAPIVRIDRPSATPDRFLDSMLASLEADPAFASEPDAATPEERLTGLLRAHATEDLVLVLDQFETLFTLDPGDRDAKVRFMTLVGSLVNRRTMAPAEGAPDDPAAPDPRPWLLIVLREEFLAALDPYRHLIPGGLGARMRLELLDADRARRAIQGPAEAVGVTIEDDAATALVDDLRQVQETDDDGTVHSVPGATVEPVQLQVTCLRMWLHVAPEEGASITAADLPPASGVTEALAAYYAEAVARIAAETGTSELAIRDWFGESLIVQHAGRNIRAQVRDGVAPPVRAACEDAHLVRGDERGGVRWYELAHDRLVTPVIDDNARWLREHARPLLLRARAWEVGGRAASLLLRGKDLADARTVASGATDLTPVEQELLEASTAAASSEQRGRRQRRAFAGLAGIVGLLVLVAVWFGFSLADRDRKVTAMRLAVLAGRTSVQAPWLAAAQRFVAAELSAGLQPLIASASCCAPQLERVFVTGTRAVDVAIEPGGDRVVWSEEGGPFRVAAVQDGQDLMVEDAGIWSMALSPDGRRLAVGDGDGRVRLLDAASLDDPTSALEGAVLLDPPALARGTGATPTQGIVREPGAGQASAVTAIAWSADTTTLAAAMADGRLVVWRFGGGPEALESVESPVVIDARNDRSSVITDLALSDRGTYVAATDGVAWGAWMVGVDSVPRTVPDTAATTLDFLPGTPPRLITAGKLGRIDLITIDGAPPPVGWGMTWDVPHRMTGETANILDVATGPTQDGVTQVAIARNNGIVQVIGVDHEGTLTLLGETLRADPDKADVLAWDPTGTHLVVGGATPTVSVWTAHEPPSIARAALPPLAVHVDPMGRTTAVSPDGTITETGPGADATRWAPPAAGVSYDAAVIAPDGRSIALVRAGKAITVLRAGGDAPISVETPTFDMVADLAFDADGSQLAMATDREVRTWDLAGAGPTELMRTVPLATRNPRAQVAFTPDGSMLIVAGCAQFAADGASCRLGTLDWYAVGSEAQAGSGGSAAVAGWPWALEVDPADPSTVAVGLKNGYVAVYRRDPMTGDVEMQASTWFVPNSQITALSFAERGEGRLAAGAGNGTVVLADPDGAQIVADGVGGRHREVSALAYAADGSHLVVGSGTPRFLRPTLADSPATARPPSPGLASGAVQVVDLDETSLRTHACELVRWVVSAKQPKMLLNQRGPAGCAPAPAATETPLR